MYHILEPYMDTAIRNAKKLNAVNQEREHRQCLHRGQKVYELIEKLKPYLKAEKGENKSEF